MIAYHRPRSLDEALAIRAAQDVAVIAGATDIYPSYTARRAWGDPTHKDVLDITAISGLDAIEEAADGWRIGCLVTWTKLLRTTLPPLFDGLKAAAREIGGVQVQNRGTIVGNLITASPAGDGIPNLLVLDARIEITGPAGVRFTTVGAFLTGYRATALRADEIVTAIHVPCMPAAFSAFRKLGARRYLVISAVMAAVVMAADATGRIADARIAVGACAPVAQRLPLLEASLTGVALTEAARLPAVRHLEPLAPISDIRASARYRRDAALVLVRDLLRGFA
jgi:N-methylhydantoinase B